MQDSGAVATVDDATDVASITSVLRVFDDMLYGRLARRGSAPPLSLDLNAKCFPGTATTSDIAVRPDFAAKSKRG